MKTIKCVLVGNTCVGKTCLLESFTTNTFPEVTVPTVFNNYSSEITVNSTSITLDLHDTSGNECYDRLRPLVYPQTDVIIMCFSVCCPESFVDVKNKWYPEIPRVPLLLVGTKIDERENPGFLKRLKEWKLTPITKQEGEDLARKIRATNYLECSALKRVRVREVFVEAVHAHLNAKPEPFKKHCMLL